MEHNYYLIFERKRGGGELSFNVGARDKASTLIRLGGKNAIVIYNKLLSILSRAGCLTPIETGNPSVHWIRDDVGPVLGMYLILVRRARNTKYWLSFLDELLMGEYARLGGMFSILLESAMELSKEAPRGGKRRPYILSPAVASSFSSALKTFIRTLKKHESL